MSLDVKVRWSFDYNGGYMAGDVLIDRAAWDVMTPDERVRHAKAKVGEAVLRHLDVDWYPTNADVDAPRKES